MKIQYPQIGICGLSCRLCPTYHSESKSQCAGCKSDNRMAVGCPFITCAVKHKGVEFCWQCKESAKCEKWSRHIQAGKKSDSFKCYQTLEADIAFIRKRGVGEFDNDQKSRERLLVKMLNGFNEGRSKSYYCIAATVSELDELKDVVSQAEKASSGLDVKGKSRLLHAMLDELAKKKGYLLKLRK